MKIFKRILLLLVIVFTVIIYINSPKLNMISGYASKYMASSILIGHRSAKPIVANDSNMPLIKIATTEFDSKNAFGNDSIAVLLSK